MRLIRFKEKFVPYLEKPEVRTVDGHTGMFKVKTTRMKPLKVERHHVVTSHGRYKPIVKTGIIIEVTHVEEKLVQDYTPVELIEDVGHASLMMFKDEIGHLNGMKLDEVENTMVFLHDIKFIGRIKVTRQLKMIGFQC